MNIDTLHLEELAKHCSEETSNYFHKMAQDTRYCFELFRRTFIDHVDDALAYIWNIYNPQLKRWVTSHPQFAASSETAEYLSSVAFEHFYFALLGSKFHRFPTLSHIMQYMKMCVHTAVAQLGRKGSQNNLPLLDNDMADQSDPFADLNLEALWNRICEILPNENHRLLAWCTFVLGMKPAEIAKRYQHIWTDDRHVRITLYRVRERLRNAPDIRGWLGLDE